MQNIEVNKIVAKLTASRELVKKITILKPEKAKFLGNLIDSYIAEIKDLQSKKRSKSTAAKSVGFDLSIPNDEKSVENIAAERMARIEKEMNSALTRVEYEVVEVVNPINTNMQAANAVLVRDNARLQRELVAANVEIAANRVEIVRLGGQLAALTAQRDQLQRDLATMEGRYNTTAAARDKLGKDLEIANAEIAANRVDIAANRADIAANRAEIGRLNEQLAALTAQRDALLAERNALLAERNALLAERNALQAQIAENNAAHANQIQELNRVAAIQAATLAQSTADLATERAALQAARVQLARLNEQLAATGNQNIQLIRRIAALNGEVQAANARADAQQRLVEQTQTQLTESQNRVRQLEAELDAARNAAAQAALAAQAELDAARNAAVPNVDDRTLAGQVIELQLFQQRAEEALAAANQRALDQERNHQIQIGFIEGQITQLNRLNDELRAGANQLAYANDEHIAMAERNKVREKIVKGINDRVRELLEISENEVTELVGVIQDLQNQLVTVRAQLAAAQQANAGGVQALRQQLTAAQQQLAAMQERNRLLALEKDANNNTLQANAATIAQNNKEIKRLTARIAKLEDGLRDQRLENKAGKADRANAANIAEGALKSQISRLQNQLDNAQQNYAAAQRRVEHLKQLNRLAAASIRDKNQRLETTAARITELEAQLAAAANNGQLQQQLDAARAEYTAAQAELRQQIGELSKQIGDITHEYEIKASELVVAREQINAMDASHSEELGELNNLLAQERATYNTLEAQLQTAQRGLEDARRTQDNLEKQVAKLQKDNQEQRNEFDGLLRQREDAIAEMVKIYEKTIDELTTQVDKDKNSNQQAAAANNALTGARLRLTDTQNQLAEAQQQLAEAQQQLADYNQIKNELAVLNAAHTQLITEVQGKDNQIAVLTERNNALQTQLDAAKQELAAERAKPNGANIDPAAKAEIDQLREKLTADIAGVEAQRAEVAARLTAFLEDKKNLETQVEELRGLLGVANQERDTANNARDAANASNATLQQQLADLQARLQANEANQNKPQIAPAELATLQQENAGLRQQIADLEQELTTSKQLNTNLIISMFKNALLLLKKTNTDDSLNNQIVIFERMSDRSITINTIDEIFTILESRLDTRRAIIKLDSLNERYATLTTQMVKVKNEGHLNWLDQLDVWINGLEQYEQHVKRKLQEIRTELENTYKNDPIGLRNALAFQEGDNPTIDQYIANYNIFLLNLRRYNEVLKTYITKIRSTKMDNIASLGENSEIIDIIGNFEGIMDALNKYILRVRQKAGKLDQDEDLQERQASFIIELRTQVQTAEAQTREKEARIAELNTQLEQRAAENTAIRNQITELQGTIATLKQRETEIETEMRKITGTSAQQLEQLKQLETEKNAVSAELRAVQLQNEGLVGDYREASDSNNDLLLELEEITAEKNQATNQLKEITNRNKELEQILDELNSQAAADIRKARAEQAEAAAKAAALAKSEAAAAKSAARAASASEANNNAPVNLNKPPSNQNEEDDRKAEIAQLEQRVQKFKELADNYKKLIDADTKDINEKVKNFIVELNAYTTNLSSLIGTINGQINAVANLERPEVIQTNKSKDIEIKTNLIKNIDKQIKNANAAKITGKVPALRKQLAAEKAELAKLQNANQAAPQPNQQVGQDSISTIMANASIPLPNIKSIDKITNIDTVDEEVIRSIDTHFRDLDNYDVSIANTLAKTKEKVQQIQDIFIRTNGPEKQLINNLLTNLRQITVSNFRTLKNLNDRFIQIRDSYNRIVSYKSKYEDTDKDIALISADLAKLQPVVNGKNEAEVKGGYIGGYLDDEVDNTSYSLNTYVPSVIAHSGNMLYIGIIALFAFCVILLIYSMAKYIYKTQFKSEIYYNIHKHKHGRRRSSVGHYDE